MAEKKRMKLRKRMNLSFTLIILLVLIMGLISYTGIKMLSDKTTDVLNTDAKIAEHSSRLRANVTALRQYEKDVFINLQNPESVKEYLEKWTIEFNSSTERLEQVEKIIYHDEDHEAVTSMKNNLAEYRAGFLFITDSIQKGRIQNTTEANIAIGKYKTPVRNLAEQAKKFATVNIERMQQLTGYINSLSSKLIIIITASILLILSLGIFISINLSRTIFVQMGGDPEDVIDIVKTLATGDFTVRIQNDKSNTTSLLNYVREMKESLSSLIADITEGAENLSQAIEQITSGNMSLSQRTSEQASSLEEIAATIEETSSTIRQNTENAKEAEKVSNNTSTLADEGDTVVMETVSSINEISSASKKIGEIITVINEIAFQTNLLALNAAVEAARAGEQGRGFAVVAGEVRNLAQRSGTAAKEINDLIKDSIDKIERGTELTNKSGESLKEIVQAIKSVSRLIAEISTASDEQLQGINQISSAVNELDSMTQTNASLVEETASASEEISGQAKTLLGMVQKFKIEHETAIN